MHNSLPVFAAAHFNSAVVAAAIGSDKPNESHNDALIRVTKGTCNNQTETRSEQDMIVPSFPYR